MPRKPVVDDLVARAHEKRSELASLGRDIEASATNICVVFVDLANSTELKDRVRPDEWLVYVASFLQFIIDAAKTAGGRLVKRIGDEVMLTFSAASAANSFIEGIAADPRASAYRFKCAADFGKAYFFQFEPTLEPDPYGIVVDRCARIAKLGQPSVALCSSSFVSMLEKHEDYVDVGEFRLKGISDSVAIFARPFQAEPPPNYHDAILAALNSEDAYFSGFKTQSRVHGANDIRIASPSRMAHPFLVRELISIPRLPLSPEDLFSKIEAQTNLDKKEAARPYIGYLVEWAGTLSQCSFAEDFITVSLSVSEPRWTSLLLYCVSELFEVVQSIRKNDIVTFRGIIKEISSGVITLDYIEFCTIIQA